MNQLRVINGEVRLGDLVSCQFEDGRIIEGRVHVLMQGIVVVRDHETLTYEHCKPKHCTKLS